MLKDYTTVVVGTDGSELAVPTVTRAAWIATKEDADLVIVCAYGGGSRRADAKVPLTETAPSRFRARKRPRWPSHTPRTSPSPPGRA